MNTAKDTSIYNYNFHKYVKTRLYELRKPYIDQLIWNISESKTFNHVDILFFTFD